MAKRISKETRIKHRFGNYELRISDVRCEVEEVVNRTAKHVYGSNSYEYGLFMFLLSETKMTEDGVKPKDVDDIKKDTALAEMLVYMLAYTNLIFSSFDFRLKYYELIRDVVKKDADIPEDENVLDDLKTEHQAKEILNDTQG